MKRIGLFAAGLVLAVLLVSPAATSPRPAVAGGELSVFDRALVQHDTLEPVQRGDRLMAGERLAFDDASARGAAAAAEASASPTPGVDQDGVCDATEQQEGAIKTFWVHDFKLGQDIEKTFVLTAKTDHVYMWVAAEQDQTVVARTDALAAAQRFEEIYSTDRAYFGHQAQCDALPYREPPRMSDIWGGPWYDADDDRHINIVNFDIDANAAQYVAGYYSSGDEYPKVDSSGKPVNPHSNEGEFFYMNSLLVSVGSEDYLGVLAHEFYHMIQFANDANEDSWVNEGMADVAIEVNGMGGLTSGHTSAYASAPEDQLTHWSGDVIDYGNAYSFFSYFLSHYGPPDDPATPFKENYELAEDITKVEADGLAGVDAVLAGNPFRSSLADYYRTRTATDVYLDRAVANVVNDRSVGAGQYGFVPPLQDFHVSPHGSLNGPGTQSGSARTFGDQIYMLSSAADGAVTVDGASTIPIVPNTPTSGTHELWGNRVDETTTWAQKTATLPAGGSPHLRFNYWYSIEPDYDYAYLRVSDDGGSTWTNLACCGSVTTNPNGNNRGNGMTANSGATTLDGSPRWQAADVDLSAYAGKTLTIRFEYVTDPATNEPGFTVDDVELVDGSSTIWPKATFETGLDGFDVGGTGAPTFLRITPDSPNQLLLQLVKRGPNGVTVSRYSGTDAGSAVRASAAGDAFDSIAIFTSLTPITSEPYAFTLTSTGSPLGALTPPTLTATGGSRANLTWTPAGNAGTRPPARYVVQESPVYVQHLGDDAESGLGQWSSTFNAGNVPWEQSQLKKHSGSNSFYATAPDKFLDSHSYLTYKQPIAVPSGASTTLTFWDWALNEPEDQTAVEVSTDDGATWEVAWKAERAAETDAALPGFASDPLSLQTVDLTRWAGSTIRLRFDYFSADVNYFFYTPYGWFVDDIALVTSDWRQVAETTDTVAAIAKEAPGTYHYRVGAVYTDFAAGPWSNVASADVVPRPDLALAPADVSYSSAKVKGGDRVAVTATVRNLGAAQAQAVSVRFADNDVAFATPTTGTIAPGGSETVTAVWDTKGKDGVHTIEVAADPSNAIVEDSEANNAVTGLFTVKANKVQNGSFEQARTDGSAPEAWTGQSTSAGSASYGPTSGTDGSPAVTFTGTGGNALVSGSPTWTSDPIAVVPGEVLDVAASVRAGGTSSAPSVGLAYLGAAGQLVKTVTTLTAPLTTAGFQRLEQTVTVPANATQVRIVLAGFAASDLRTAGTVTFDDIGVFAH